MKISHEGEKTIGFKTLSDNEADQANEYSFLNRLEILQEETLEGGSQFIPAKLKDGYYPIEYFRPSQPVMADIVRNGDPIVARPSINYYDYIGPEENN